MGCTRSGMSCNSIRIHVNKYNSIPYDLNRNGKSSIRIETQSDTNFSPLASAPSRSAANVYENVPSTLLCIGANSLVVETPRKFTINCISANNDLLVLRKLGNNKLACCFHKAKLVRFTIFVLFSL